MGLERETGFERATFCVGAAGCLLSGARLGFDQISRQLACLGGHAEDTCRGMGLRRVGRLRLDLDFAISRSSLTVSPSRFSAGPVFSSCGIREEVAERPEAAFCSAA